MKRFVLSCCILAATSTMVFAQASKSVAKSKSTKTTTTKAKKTATEANFTAKVNMFEAGVLRNNPDLAKQNSEDLKMMMSEDLRSMKPRIVNAANEAEKNKLMDIMNKKQNIYFEIIHAASDIKGNGAMMVKKYREYQATL